jgi:hypothetical protein
MKYLLYINEQSIKPLVNSIKEAMKHAEAHLEHKPSLRIECYRAPTIACVWSYDYHLKEWVKAADHRNTELCCLVCESKHDGCN